MNMAASGLMSLTIYGGLRMLKSAKRSKVKGLVILYGKTMACKKLSDAGCFLVDLDEYIKDKHPEVWGKYRDNDVQYLLNVYPLIVKHITTILNNFNNKQIVLVSKSHSLLEQMGVKKIWSYFPDNGLIQKLPLNEDEKIDLEKQKLLMASKVRKFYCVGSFEEMYLNIRKKLKLKTPLNCWW